MANDEHELRILEEIERNPETTQADLAAQLGVAVGSINWYVKRLVKKGYVKVTHLQRRKLHYFVTPSGISLKIKLTRSYMDVSLRTYRVLRESARKTLAEVRRSGFTSVCLDGDDEATEILRLTCLEHGVKVEKKAAGIPILRVDGKEFAAALPNGKEQR